MNNLELNVGKDYLLISEKGSEISAIYVGNDDGKEVFMYDNEENCASTLSLKDIEVSEGKIKITEEDLSRGKSIDEINLDPISKHLGEFK